MHVFRNYLIQQSFINRKVAEKRLLMNFGYACYIGVYLDKMLCVCCQNYKETFLFNIILKETFQVGNMRCSRGFAAALTGCGCAVIPKFINDARSQSFCYAKLLQRSR